MSSSVASHRLPFSEAVRVWARIAALSFGGPAGQIAVMHRILVEEKRWIGEERFLYALNYCVLLPGPEAQQLAIYIGWLLHRTKGGIVAGALFVLPGFIAILALSFAYVLFGTLPAIEGLFFGLKAAVLAVVLQAAVRIGSRSLKSIPLRLIAAASFVAIFAYKMPFPITVAAAGLIGFAGGRAGLPAFRVGGHPIAGSSAVVHDRDSLLGHSIPPLSSAGRRQSLLLSVAILTLWLFPVAAIWLGLGPDNVFSRIAIFFSKMAVVTFGGAYAVLSYVAQQAVQHYHWLSAREMLDGLGMAETTPGPLIMVTQFVGFLAAYREPGALNPLAAATLGAIVTTWVTFLPCFLWIFLGAPFVEQLRANRALSGALTAITAAVVGVIVNLALWFALHSLFGAVQPVSFAGADLDLPILVSVNLPATMLTLASMAAVFRLNLGVLQVIAGSATMGVVLRLWGLA